MPNFVDYGGNVGSYKLKGSSCGVCVSCGARKFVSQLSWTRATRPTCPGCGGLLLPSVSAQKKNKLISTVKSRGRKERRCETCKAVLSQSNSNSLCRPCRAKYPSGADFVKGFKLLRKELREARGLA